MRELKFCSDSFSTQGQAPVELSCSEIGMGSDCSWRPTYDNRGASTPCVRRISQRSVSLNTSCLFPAFLTPTTMHELMSDPQTLTAPLEVRIPCLEALSRPRKVPIPVHTGSSSEEMLLAFWDTCPSYFARRDAVIEKYSDLVDDDFDIDELKEHILVSQQLVTRDARTHTIWDNLNCMKAHNLNY